MRLREKKLGARQYPPLSLSCEEGASDEQLTKRERVCSLSHSFFLANATSVQTLVTRTTARKAIAQSAKNARTCAVLQKGVREREKEKEAPRCEFPRFFLSSEICLVYE